MVVFFKNTYKSTDSPASNKLLPLPHILSSSSIPLKTIPPLLTILMVDTSGLKSSLLIVKVKEPERLEANSRKALP